MTPVDTSKNTNKRVLVLGSAPHTKLVTAYTWDAIPAKLNVADYDVVILNLFPLRSEGLSQSPEQRNFPSLANFLPLFFSQGSEVIAIGIPGHASLSRDSHLPLSWWLPIDLAVKYDAGEVVSDVHPDFAYYFRHVKEWFFWVSQQPFEKPNLSFQLRSADVLADDIVARIIPIAQTRAHQAIAFELEVQVYSHTRSIKKVFDLSQNGDIQLLAESGKIIWLPPTTEIPVYEAINLLLRERYGLCLEQAPPVWVEEYKLPNQLPIELDIEQCNQEIQSLVERRNIAQQSLEQASRFNRLLYEQGEVLESVVQDALRELGAEVQPTQPGHEDGRLVDPMGRNGILEVKGLSGSLALKYVRQLDQWFRDAVAEEDWQGKPILIANLRCDKLPEKRTELFPDNCIRTAKQFGQCLMTTTQLFVALRAHQRGELDLEEFWNTIHGTNGVCPLPELVQREASS